MKAKVGWYGSKQYSKASLCPGFEEVNTKNEEGNS